MTYGLQSSKKGAGIGEITPKSEESKNIHFLSIIYSQMLAFLYR